MSLLRRRILMGGDGYIPLKYLQATGTQWIVTDYTVGSSETFGFRIVLSDVSGSNMVLGCQNNSGYRISLSPWSNGELVWCSTSNLRTITGSNTTFVQADYRTWTIDWTQFTHTTVSRTINYPIAIFGVNASNPSQVAAAKIYSVVFYENGNIVRDYIPALRKSDKKPGMYDRVTGAFLTNSGTGEFLYDYYPVLEITSSGNFFRNVKGNRYYSKVTADPAISGLLVSKISSGTWFLPWLLSKTENGVKYGTSYNSTQFSSIGSINYNGETWYLGDVEYGFAPGYQTGYANYTPTDFPDWRTIINYTPDASNQTKLAALTNAAKQVLDVYYSKF